MSYILEGETVIKTVRCIQACADGRECLNDLLTLILYTGGPIKKLFDVLTFRNNTTAAEGPSLFVTWGPKLLSPPLAPWKLSQSVMERWIRSKNCLTLVSAKWHTVLPNSVFSSLRTFYARKPSNPSKRTRFSSSVVLENADTEGLLHAPKFSSWSIQTWRRTENAEKY